LVLKPPLPAGGGGAAAGPVGLKFTVGARSEPGLAWKGAAGSAQPWTVLAQMEPGKVRISVL
jgi:hypothetical protein